MEVKVQVKQLKRLAQELETVAKQLASSIARLEKPHRHPDRPEIAKQLRTLGSSLKEQAETCKDMAAVLKQAASLYEKTEEAVIQAAETETRLPLRYTLPGEKGREDCQPLWATTGPSISPLMRETRSGLPEASRLWPSCWM